MILTCPACATKYVVKDGAIPPGGRQVRCASCKHSWHQDPEPLQDDNEAPATGDFGGPPQAEPASPSEPVMETPAEAEADALVADAPEPQAEGEEAEWESLDQSEPAPVEEGELRPEFRPDDIIDEAPVWQPPGTRVEEEFVGYDPIAHEDARSSRSRWPVIIGLLVLIAAAAAAFWFLAPPEWKARAGIAQAGTTPLQLMITTSDRQPLESGNELVAISGRVINPTDREQKVPPIHAELRDKQTHALVHRWTIAPPAPVLAPRSSASFNSAEVDVPKGGDELTVTLGGQI